MGGSTVNERFTPEKLTIVGNLNRLLLDDKNKIEIFNGGVDGQSTIGLINNFDLSEIQSKAILELRLQKLTGLEMDKIKAKEGGINKIL